MEQKTKRQRNKKAKQKTEENIMKIICRPNGCGKTYELLQMAAKDKNLRIVCSSEHKKARIILLAKEMKLDIAEPITFRNFINKQSLIGVDWAKKKYLIDNLDIFLQEIIQTN